MEPKALGNIRVLDLSRVLAGPFCTMLLADMGADVIKVEMPGRGDDSRQFPPFIKGSSAYYINLNRNKRSITLNLKNPEGNATFLRLVEISDVVIENFSPGTMDRLGLGYEKLKSVNPRVVYASISGFGHYGPYKDRPSYDLIGQAMGGIMSITGWPGTPPTRTGTAIADVLAGLFCCIGILAALESRNTTGVGRRVDISLVDSVVSALENLTEMYLVTGENPTRIGNRYEFVYPYDTFRTKDGWVAIGVGNDEIWQRFCEATGMEKLSRDSRYETNAKRVREHESLKAVVTEWTTERTTHEVVSLLLASKIPAAPVYTVKDIVEDSHIARAREMIVEIDQPGVGVMKVVGCPIKMPGTGLWSPAPRLGEHTTEVLAELLKMNEEQIEKLRLWGAV